MKKKLLTVNILMLIFVGIVISNINNIDKEKTINYNGNSLMVTVDDKTMDVLPSSGNYYLTNYECDNVNAVVSWDRTNYKLAVSNGNNGGNVSCSLTFKSNPLLSEMPVGSYVDYVGSGGSVGDTKVSCQTNGKVSSSDNGEATEAPNSCSGQNAREDLDKSGYTYGYCYTSNEKYLTTGWRIAYIKDNKVKIVSAGAPECVTRTSSFENTTYIKESNAKALKYCNKDYVDGDCVCDSSNMGECDSASTDAWAIGDTDFYFMTNELGKVGKRLTEGSSTLGVDGGTVGTDMYCYGNYSYLECGYNNDLIDNGGTYWFASKFSSSDSRGVYWSASKRAIQDEDGEYTYGFRPVINLSATVYVTGGAGTMSNPYTLGNK